MEDEIKKVGFSLESLSNYFLSQGFNKSAENCFTKDEITVSFMIKSESKYSEGVYQKFRMLYTNGDTNKDEVYTWTVCPTKNGDVIYSVLEALKHPFINKNITVLDELLVIPAQNFDTTLTKIPAEKTSKLKTELEKLLSGKIQETYFAELCKAGNWRSFNIIEISDGRLYVIKNHANSKTCRTHEQVKEMNLELQKLNDGLKNGKLKRDFVPKVITPKDGTGVLDKLVVQEMVFGEPFDSSIEAVRDMIKMKMVGTERGLWLDMNYNHLIMTDSGLKYTDKEVYKYGLTMLEACDYNFDHVLSEDDSQEIENVTKVIQEDWFLDWMYKNEALSKIKHRADMYLNRDWIIQDSERKNSLTNIVRTIDTLLN